MDATIETTAAATGNPWEAVADGDYAIVELFGHTTLVGRITEVERFGAKMLAMELLYGGKLLDPIYHGGAAIYRLSPCSRQIAWQRQHSELWQLPPAIRAVLPPELLPAPQATLPLDEEYCPPDDDDSPF
jgi:hypothetical protein